MLLVVVYVIAFVGGYVFLIPQTLMSPSYADIQNVNFEGTSAIFTTLSVLGTFGSSLVYAIIYIAIPMHYFSQVQKKDKADLMNKSDNVL